MKKEFSLPRGMKDIEPEEFLRRSYVYGKIENVLKRYGFQFVEPSALENFETLSAKSGPAIEKEIYVFKDKSDRKIALRFDLTVGMARMVASKKWPKPIKLACISNMWRYDRPQYARYRSFYQWDIEIFGSDNQEADAEIIAVICDILDSFSLDYEIRISNRKLVEGFVIGLGVSEKKAPSVLRIIDKMAKISKKELEEYLGKSMKKEQIDKLLLFCQKANDLKYVEKNIPNNELAKKGAEELKNLFSLLRKLGKWEKCSVDLSIVRGIDYYTGIVFEAWLKEEELGAVAGGGRFDDLTKIYGEEMGAVGVAGGIERLLLALEKKTLDTEKIPKIQVIFVSDSTFEKALEILQKLRKFTSADMDLNKRNIRKQMDYANARNVPYVIFVGEKELAEGKVKLKNMATGNEKMIDIDKLEDLGNL